MQVVSKVELKLENYERCHTLCDNDCPIGEIFDYSCALQAFCLEKMKAAHEKAKESESEKE